ncbi:hypothetical protein D0Z00_000454 [Geotrichum galactomycetum]|uniref:Uncharacterized protein n=1 Tax=Geotrichum galactomycetum TaxID=27317 RepID=A0ACB6V9S6_9ASCO|nr:hypothetical protein D0Z00_000454 [Geotrichum candidum]
MISSISNKDTLATSLSNTRPRAFSHTRTNSSSSSSSSLLISPVGPSAQFNNFYSSSSPAATPTASSFPMGINENKDRGAGQVPASGQFTPSEAAAVAALRGTSPQDTTTSKFMGNYNYSQDSLTIKDSSSSIKNIPVNSVLHFASSTSLASKNGTHNGFKSTGPPSAAASAAAFASKPKESALSKAKMFARQATTLPHLNTSSTRSGGSSRKVDLTIQAIPLPPGRPSLSELSPIGRSSKELDRIASNLGGTVMNPLSPMHSGSRDGQHKHHLSFRTRKDPHSNVVLSSSSSNSKLVSDQGSIYSFHPSSPGALLKALPALETKSMPVLREDTAYVAEESWSYIQSWVMPIFKGEGLRVPVEKVNYVLTLHLESRIQQGAKARDMLAEFRDLTKQGMLKLDVPKLNMVNAKFLQRLVDIWQFFFSQVLPYWEAVFLPLQLEFEGTGPVLGVKVAAAYWGTLLESSEDLNIRRMTLIAFRDWIIIPLADRIESMYQHLYDLRVFYILI